VEATLERAHELKASFEFVLEAEGELAESLETYAIAQSRRERHDSVQQDLIIDSFLTEAKVGDKTPLDLFWKANQSFQTAIASSQWLATQFYWLICRDSNSA